MRLAENTGCKKSPKIRRLGTIAQLCRVIPSQLRHVSTIRKKHVKQQYLIHMFSKYVELQPVTAEIGSGVWGTPANFNGFRVFASSLQRRRSRRPTKLCTMFNRLLGCYTIYIFGGSCPRTEFCQVQNSRYVEVLRSPTLAMLLHRTPAAGVSETLRHGARNMDLWNFRTQRRHRYSAGRPSCWASAHIILFKKYSYALCRLMF